MRLICLRTACWLGIALLAGACGTASRAQVHDEDLKKVFPWPRDAKELRIRVKPLTTMANACVWFGSYEQVTVFPDTTFYITDELDKTFAYTPSRSPIRRLAPVETIEIRWPLQAPAQPTGPADGQEDQAGQPGSAKDAAKKEKAPSRNQKGDKNPPPSQDDEAG